MRKSTKNFICILSTGGTISMQKMAQGYSPMPGYLLEAMGKSPELQNPDMPDYHIHEFDEPIDSANMTLSHWQQMGEYIQRNYHQYDGFVVLHGTDTMAYSASALSFMLEHLAKPVIFTGSQLPLFETRSDARENLIKALWIAGNYKIPEVCIYFNNKLFRGNRATKVDANSFAAFASPNFPILGKVGVDLKIRRDLLREVTSDDLQLQTLKPFNVSVLRIFPGMSLEMVRHVLQAPLQGLILQTFGTGNAPQHPEFLAVLQEAVERGVIILNSSQCTNAKVRMSDYAAGSALLKVGVISGADMTVEAAITKLFYLHSKTLSQIEIKQQMMFDLRGELTL